MHTRMAGLATIALLLAHPAAGVPTSVERALLFATHPVIVGSDNTPCALVGSDPCGDPNYPCTGAGPTGGRPCCSGSHAVLIDAAYKCIADAPLPGAAQLCDEGEEIVETSEDWAWNSPSYKPWSCQAPALNSNAKPAMCSGDPTSVVLRAPGNGPVCMGAESCLFDARTLVRIEADISMFNCEGTWAAAMWVTPSDWGPSQELSGEIDIFETCVLSETSSSVCTSLGQNPGWNAHGYSKCWQDQFSPNGFNGHMSLLVVPNANTDADVKIAVCAGHEPCDMSGDCSGPDCPYTTYNNWYSTHGCQADGCPFHLFSDIWAGTYGDGPAPGYLMCNRQGYNVDATTCSVSARNVKVTTTEGNPLPAQCAAFQQ